MAQRDWSEIKQLLAGTRDGSRTARDKLALLVGADHGSDQVAWSSALRELLRADVEAALTSVSALKPAVTAMFDRTPIAFYGLDFAEELRRAATAIDDPTLRTAVLALATDANDAGPASIVPEDRLWLGDSECITTAADYETVAKDLLALAKLRATAITCAEGNPRMLDIIIGQRRYRASLRGDTDYIDEPPLLACLNEILATTRSKRRFYVVTDPRWGQECGIALATAAEAKRLRAASFMTGDE